jgi:hypothetical protein
MRARALEEAPRGLGPGRSDPDHGAPRERLRLEPDVARDPGLFDDTLECLVGAGLEAAESEREPPAEAGVSGEGVGALAVRGKEPGEKGFGPSVLVGQPGEGGEAEQRAPVPGIAAQAPVPPSGPGGCAIPLDRSRGEAHDSSGVFEAGPLGALQQQG